MENDQLTQTICELKQVTRDDADDLWQEFFPKLLQFVRTRISNIPTRDFDEEDVALSAFASFFKGVDNGRFDSLSSIDEVWRLLVTITARKITAQRRKAMALKRGEGKVRGESVFAGNSDASSCAPGLQQIMDNSQLPKSVDDIAETCSDLLNRLKDDKLRVTALMRLQGFTNKEIAERLQCSVARTNS